VSAAADSISHIVETSLRPNEVGVTYRRAIWIERDRLFDLATRTLKDEARSRKHP
jgi:hypothetical protein